MAVHFLMSADPVLELPPETVRVYQLFDARKAALDRLRHTPEELPAKVVSLRAYYREHIADFVNDWGVTIDPRNPAKGLPAVLPFTPDPRQREWIDWTHRNWLDGEYGGTEKSRDVGVSWLLVAYSISIAVLWDNLSIGWGSFSELKVDKRGELGSLFEKGREYLRWLPKEFCAGFDDADPDCSKNRLLKFPETGSSIFGEIGDQIGRGNRASIYFVDEAAYLEHDQSVDAALSKTTPCRQDVSSVRGMTNTFAQRMHKPLGARSSPSLGVFLEQGADHGVRKFCFDWRENPRMTIEDYSKFLRDWGEVITAQELDRNYQASLEGIVIPAAWVNAAVDAHVKLGIAARGERLAALDVADLGIDKNALAIRHGIVLAHLEQWSGAQSDPYATTERAFTLCDLHQARRLIYDADGGLGAGVRGDARKINEARAKDFPRRPIITLTAHLGSGAVHDPRGEMVEGRKNEDMFDNFKAQAWWALRLRFRDTYDAVQGKRVPPDSLISIPSDLPERTRLMIELSQPTHSFNKAGAMLIDKQPAGKPSPNLADSVMMCYAPRRAGLKIADSVLGDSMDDLE